MSLIHDLAKGMDPDKAVDKEVLLHAVQRQIQCAVSGNILDISNAVLVTRVRAENGGRAAIVITGEAWDEVKGRVLPEAEAKGDTVEVIDGREFV